VVIASVISGTLLVVRFAQLSNRDRRLPDRRGGA